MDYRAMKPALAQARLPAIGVVLAVSGVPGARTIVRRDVPHAFSADAHNAGIGENSRRSSAPLRANENTILRIVRGHPAFGSCVYRNVSCKKVALTLPQ